jgi:hypothetical protein
VPIVFYSLNINVSGELEPEMGAESNSLTGWLEQKFAFQRLDNALLILSSLVNVFFAVGNSAYGRGILSFYLPLFFIAWAMPIWSGYFLGAIFRRNIVDRIRGWIYLLGGSTSYFLSLGATILIPLPLGPEASNSLIFQEMIILIFLSAFAIAFVSFLACSTIVSRLFKTVVRDNKMLTTSFFCRPVIFTFLAIWLFSATMSAFLFWDTLRVIPDAQVPQLTWLLFAGVISLVGGILFEILAAKSILQDREQRTLQSFYARA